MCEEGESMWREAQQEMLEHQIFLADVIAEDNPKLADRFAIEDLTPIYAKFKGGFMYSRAGHFEKEGLVEWILQDWSPDEAHPVPRDSSAPAQVIQEALDAANAQLQNIINKAFSHVCWHFFVLNILHILYTNKTTTKNLDAVLPIKGCYREDATIYSRKPLRSCIGRIGCVGDCVAFVSLLPWVRRKESWYRKEKQLSDIYLCNLM